MYTSNKVRKICGVGVKLLVERLLRDKAGWMEGQDITPWAVGSVRLEDVMKVIEVIRNYKVKIDNSDDGLSKGK